MNTENVGFVTGSAGFLGRALCRHLLAKGWRVVGLDIRDSQEPGVVHVDTAGRSLTDLTEAMAPHASERAVVFHLATIFIAHHSPNDVSRLLESNVVFGGLLLESMKSLNLRRFVYTGSIWQHCESERYNPVSLYAATKQAFEDLSVFYSRHEGFRSITLKMYDNYGENDPRKKLINILLDKAKAQTMGLPPGPPIELSPGDQLIDLVHVDDVLTALTCAAHRVLGTDPLSPESFSPGYRVCTGNMRSIRDVVRVIEQVTDQNLPVRWGMKPYRPREMMSPWTLGPKLPGWNAEISLEAGMKRLWDSLLSQE